MDKQATLSALANQLQENLGNRLTVALANGIIQVLEQEIAKAEAIRAAVDSGQLGSLNGVIVKGDTGQVADAP